MLDRSRLQGVFVPMVTPTTAEGKVDKVATVSVVKHLIDGGVQGLVPLGATGEYGCLSTADRAEILEIVVKEGGGEVPVIAGVLSTGFKDAVDAGLDFKKAGADGILLLPPYFPKGTQEGICEYFREFIAQVQLPVLIYDIPYRTSVILEPATIEKIVDENKLVVGLKACNTDLAHFSRMVALVGDKIAILGGEDYLFLAEMMLGARGGILATANVFPSTWVKMSRLIGAGEIEAAKHIHFGMLPFLDACFSEPNPGPMKESMSIVGVPVGQAMRPLYRPNEQTINKLKTIINSLREHPL